MKISVPLPLGEGPREAPGEGRKSQQILIPSPCPLPEGPEGEGGVPGNFDSLTPSITAGQPIFVQSHIDSRFSLTVQTAKPAVIAIEAVLSVRRLRMQAASANRVHQ